MEEKGSLGKGGVEERRGEWGSNLSSIQLQKLLLPTITTMIQKFVLRTAVCHCRRERGMKKTERVCAPVKSGETRSILQREADRLAIAVY